MTLYLVANTLPLENVPLPAPVLIASITTDDRFLTGLDAERIMRGLAGKLGLFDVTVYHGDAQGRPGEQMLIPFPPD